MLEDDNDLHQLLLKSTFEHAARRVISGQTMKNRLYAWISEREDALDTHGGAACMQIRWPYNTLLGTFKIGGAVLPTRPDFIIRGMDKYWFGDKEGNYTFKISWPNQSIWWWSSGLVCMSWGICYEGRNELVVLINKTMTVIRYRNRVIEPIIVLFFSDNARYHCMRITSAYNIVVLQKWTAWSSNTPKP